MNNLKLFIKEMVSSVLHKLLIENSFEKVEDIEEKIITLKTQEDKINFAKSNLEKLGEGEGRLVFRLGESQVLKIAKDKFGLSQNKNESLTYSGLKSNDLESIVPKVFTTGPGYSYIISEFVTQANEGNFRSKTGMDFESYTLELEDAISAYKANIFDPFKDTSYSLTDLRSGERFNSREEYEDWRTDEDGNLIEIEDEEIVEAPPFIIQVLHAVIFGELLVADLLDIEHYGITNDGRLVLIDTGLSFRSALQRY